MDTIPELDDFKAVRSVDEIYKLACEQIRSNYTNNPFRTGWLSSDTQKEKWDLIKINSRGFWTFECGLTSQKSKYRNSKKVRTLYKRGYISGVANEFLAWRLGYEMSLRGKYVCIYNPRGDTHLIVNGITSNMGTEDFVTGFSLKYDRFGNPSFKKHTHVWNYGTDLDRVEGYFEDKSVENKILDRFVEVCIVEPDYKDRGSIVKEVSHALEKILS